MSQLPSLSLGNIPWSTPHRYRPVGGGGRKWSHEDSLISSLDEVIIPTHDDDDNDSTVMNESQTWKYKMFELLKIPINCCKDKQKTYLRSVVAGQNNTATTKYSPNLVCNQKYNIFTFVPKVLFQQFKVFLNFYFLLVALSQLIPQLRIGYWYTYWGPLIFVILVTMCRELFDDVKRYVRDKEVNNQRFIKITKEGSLLIPSKDIRVSDILLVQKDQHIPADMIILRTSDKTGTCFIKTDQLDGETDWKLRVITPSCIQKIHCNEDIFSQNIIVVAESPQSDIHSFSGTLSMNSTEIQEPLSLNNAIWANSVLASSGHVIGLVIYTGKDTRSVLNTNNPKSKSGRLDNEINTLTKVLFLSMLILAVIMLSLKGFFGQWIIYLIRYIILFSYIIPISLRVNLDMGKLVYSWMIQQDNSIPNTLVRSSTIPEELGRIEYLLCDKTGTLTQNEMVFKKLHLGTESYSSDSTNEIKTIVKTHFLSQLAEENICRQSLPNAHIKRLFESILALAICHNVIPVKEEEEDEEQEQEDIEEDVILLSRNTSKSPLSFQSSSPDEIALLKWTESVGISLVYRDLSSLHLLFPDKHIMRFKILQIFPFTSEKKRMGIIVQNVTSGEIIFYMKGADVVMKSIVEYNDWLEEECGNLAREGLRTLVIAKKILTEQQYASFEQNYTHAQLSVTDRSVQTNAVIESLEDNMELLCTTGVEDKLQFEVRPTLELLKNAGIKVWMLTGDKLETATSIAISSKLIGRNQPLFSFKTVTSRVEVHSELNQLRKNIENALIITGSSLELCVQHYETEFMELACRSPVVVCCRCSPTHKAQLVLLLKSYMKRPVCAIGDGGNDVSMIQIADVGIGIVGKEGKQASLAADFSVTQFSHISRLLLWHGRNSYKRSASLSQFVIHRGLIISAMQAVFSAIFYFAAVSLYEGILMIGYATIYTMAPVFSLVLDEDVSADVALTYPELYQELLKGRSLSFKTFFIWTLISIYQGGIIMLLGFWLFESQMIHVVSITFTTLILTELLMVSLTIRTWHGLMIIAEIISIAVYFLSLAFLNQYFDGTFLLTGDFVWKTLILTTISCLPLIAVKVGYRKCAPPSYAKLLKNNSTFRNCLKFTC